MDREQAHTLIDQLFDGIVQEAPVNTSDEAEVVKTERPDGKRAVRTKSSGDKVYVLDPEKMTRHWVTNADVLKSLGFELTDVGEIGESEAMKYQIGPAIYKVD